VRVVVASGNAEKLREFEELLRGSILEPVAPASIGVTLEVEESGGTYLENATLKARAYAEASGLPSLADDSGIEVDALGGAPGLYSARYGGPGLDDAGRTAKVLDQLKDVAENDRGARYVCALVLAGADGRTWVAEGVCEGAVARTPRGSGGFGYDPIFWLTDLERTMAELSADEKNRRSHRARAVQALLVTLNGNIEEVAEHVQPKRQ
jgi:XTP/dITP diphosphohydrolase